jgi:hypothetical protein
LRRAPRLSLPLRVRAGAIQQGGDAEARGPGPYRRGAVGKWRDPVSQTRALGPRDLALTKTHSLRSREKMRPQAGVDRLKPVPPMHANDLPVVGQALSPANRINRPSRLGRLLRKLGVSPGFACPGFAAPS